MSNPTALAGKSPVSMRPQIEAALVRASKATGVDFKYLVDTAIRESNLKTAAKSKASSATGLFQFIDQTWLATVKEFGPKFGMKAYAAAIEAAPSGRYKVTSPALSREILALRTDPAAAAMMAAAYAGKSAAYLEERLGREPRQGEVYIAHFLGLKGGGELIAAASHKPNASAAAMFPQAAKSNPTIFYDKRGQALSVRQVYYGLISKHSNEIASYNAQKQQLVRVPGQPLKLNEGLLKNLGRPRPLENALLATAQYARSNLRTQAIAAGSTPQRAEPYRPVPWPVQPVEGLQQKVQYPVAGPGSLGFEKSATVTPAALGRNGSLVMPDRRPFAGIAKVAAVRTFQVPSKPTVLEARPETGGKGERLIPADSQGVNPRRPGQIFVDTRGDFFTMRGKN